MWEGVRVRGRERANTEGNVRYELWFFFICFVVGYIAFSIVIAAGAGILKRFVSCPDEIYVIRRCIDCEYFSSLTSLDLVIPVAGSALSFISPPNWSQAPWLSYTDLVTCYLDTHRFTHQDWDPFYIKSHVPSIIKKKYFSLI